MKLIRKIIWWCSDENESIARSLVATITLAIGIALLWILCYGAGLR